MKRLVLAGALVAAGVIAAPASAAIVLSDSFDSQPPDQLNWTGDATFFVSAGAVDLIGAGGSYDFYPGNGGYLDLDGSGQAGVDPAGEITSLASFGPGIYTLKFQLGGNARRAAPRTTLVTLGDFQVAITLDSSDPLSNYSFTFNTTGGQLIFSQLGPTNFMGNILDDVSLESAIPEPATWAMMILGFGAAGAMLRRRSLAQA